MSNGKLNCLTTCLDLRVRVVCLWYIVICKEEEVSEDKEFVLTTDELIAEAPLSGAVLLKM